MLGSALDGLVTFAYGGRGVLQSPFQITTDSTHRLIVSDPVRHAVDVLDPKGKTSFTILGGEQHRLQLPAGVAVDADDNIYVADSTRGMLLVYDRTGRFMRYIGRVHGENWYEFPTGITIDRKAGHLFVADSTRNQVFILDLQGNVLKRMGKDKRLGKIGVELDFPTWISVNEKEFVVLDKGGSRIQVLDKECNLVGSFVVPRARRVAANQGGITLDKEGKIYVSDVSASVIRVYNSQGRLLFSFGQNGSQFTEFDSPQGLWIDEDDRLFVAEAENVRVQLFQLSNR